MDRRILVVDDSELTCQQLSLLLARPDRRIKVVTDGTEALERLVDGKFSLVIIDLYLEGKGIEGMELIHEIRRRDLPVTIIVMTAHASIDAAVEAMREGAYDFVTKPIDPDQVQLLVDRALADRTLLDEVNDARDRLRQRFGFHNLLGTSPGMREVFRRVERVASANCNVLITGETGTGKELVAQALHHADATRTGPIIAVNCAALPEPLLESELFGHERGAFTGADRRKQGRFELAEGGTLFLDEIGELPLGVQAKLLRVLQDGTFERVGGSETLQVNSRILAATNVDLQRAVDEGRFREDLFFRLNVVTVALPPLRDRIEDLPLLVDHFLDRLRERGYPEKSFSRDALSRMARYDWPGNVRELEHLVEQLVITAPGEVVRAEHLPPYLTGGPDDEPLDLGFDIRRPLHEITRELTDRVERHYLRAVLERYRGRIDRCAEHSGLSRRSISEKLRIHSIDKADFKPRAASARRGVAVGD
ncbi:sigma-54-dependent transcriptional regulator [Tautonia sociabilis]|uniref:Sigma-54-dependent Fis family transcriptional regulator n=1 Tax=Tautonia sociabilis TaxID=2080755 RepID=A0A432MNU0_9BACT|nr:sigma-54 dependent transcriptional regulator [Tautonia sociabilis]RUL89072.1 sigma-54-dependent Fis family transcriptional regulator [Tautonia sociabilis]